MSSQDDVPFVIRPEDQWQNFRLLELPPDLLALMTAENAPVLQVKARARQDGLSQDINAVLCTPDKTYNIRQVSTSNSVYVTRTCQSEDLDTESNGVSHAQIEAIAKCGSTIELLPNAQPSAVAEIRAVLPVYTSTGNTTSARVVTKQQLFEDIPLSDAECEAAWTSLACFEDEGSSGSFVPSSQAKNQIWHSVLTVINAEGIDLTKPLSPNARELLIDGLRGDYPGSLVTALFASISESTSSNESAIDKTKCARVIGLSYLETTCEGRAVPTTEFVESWKGLMPEVWREACELLLLQGHCKFSDNDKTISLSSTTDGGTVSGGSDAAKSSIGAKRKWHEKFRASKKS